MITFTLVKNGDCKWSLTDQAYGAMGGDCTGDGTTSISCAASGLAIGANTVFTACRDMLGNADTVLTNTALGYIVDIAPPVQSAWAPASGATIITTSPVIALTMEKKGDCKWSLTDQAYGAMGGDHGPSVVLPGADLALSLAQIVASQSRPLVLFTPTPHDEAVKLC